MAHVHATVLRRLGQQVSFCSRDAGKAAAYRERHDGAHAFSELATALADPSIESCVICVPHHLHESQVAAAIDHGKHILLEKPIAHRLDSAERIVRLAAERGADRTFMLAEQTDFVPVLTPLRRLAAAAQPIIYVFTDHSTFVPSGWRLREPESGGGVLLDLGIHDVSLAVRAFGPIADAEREVLATTRGGDIPVMERLRLRHANGTTGEVCVAWEAAESVTHLDVTTPRGVFTYRPWDRVAWMGSWPVWVGLRGANGRVPMMREYVRRCHATPAVQDVADGLPVLAAVLGGQS